MEMSYFLLKPPVEQEVLERALIRSAELGLERVGATWFTMSRLQFDSYNPSIDSQSKLADKLFADITHGLCFLAVVEGEDATKKVAQVKKEIRKWKGVDQIPYDGKNVVKNLIHAPSDVAEAELGLYIFWRGNRE